MLTQFKHYTDDELLRFIRTEPDHLAAEGELVRRVLAEEWDQDARDERIRIAEEERYNEWSRAESLEEQLDREKQKLADLKSGIAELAA